MRTACRVLLVLLSLTAAPAALSAAEPARAGTPAPFALRDGDRVVFYGDSITQDGGYARLVEGQFAPGYDHALRRLPPIVITRNELTMRAIGALAERARAESSTRVQTTTIGRIVIDGIADIAHLTPEEKEEAPTRSSGTRGPALSVPRLSRRASRQAWHLRGLSRCIVSTLLSV
jgi:hypothetical protein